MPPIRVLQIMPAMDAGGMETFCCLTFTDAAMSGGRTSRCVVLDAPCRRLRVAGDASSLEIFLNDGAAVLSTRYYPAGGQVTLRPANFTAAVYPLNL